MNSRGQHFFIFTSLVLVIAATAMAKSDLATSDQRREAVSRAAALAEPQPPVPLPADLKNPFAPPQSETTAKPEKKDKLSGDHDILAAIATRITPSGVMQSPDGQPIMILREKKLKVGDYLTITFEGADYMVQLTAISHSSFTLRLNKEELTQPLYQ